MQIITGKLRIPTAWLTLLYSMSVPGANPKLLRNRQTPRRRTQHELAALQRDWKPASESQEMFVPLHSWRQMPAGGPLCRRLDLHLADLWVARVHRGRTLPGRCRCCKSNKWSYVFRSAAHMKSEENSVGTVALNFRDNDLIVERRLQTQSEASIVCWGGQWCYLVSVGG
jgi:hypothetical protein